MAESSLISEELKNDISRESTLVSIIGSHQRNIEGAEYLRGKEIVVLVHDSPLFNKLKEGLYFDDKDRQPSFFTGDRVDQIVDILAKPNIVKLAEYEKELEELKKKYGK